MKTSFQVVLLLSVFFSSGCNTIDSNDQFAETILMDMAYLLSTKKRIKNKDSQLMPAYYKLIKKAEAALEAGPYSVTNKEKLPPSGDKHDYASYSRYWWPDPNQANGLPYIRRDGETNPASQNLLESDRQRIGALGYNTETLGLAYFLTGEEKYAKKVAELLRVWFLDEATRMNPNVNHAQCRPGHNTGTKSGILDGRLMIQALEGSLLIAKSSVLSDEEYDKLKAWAGNYFDWLTTNKMALDEADSKNNHGSFYDVQAMYFALYSDNQDAATQIARKFNDRRILTQIQPDGSMPKEMARTRPLFYSIYNLHAMLLVAHLAEKVEVNLWKYENQDSRLRNSLDYLVPYADPNKAWPYPTISETDRIEIYIILQMANLAYPDGNYLEFAEMLPINRRKTQRSNLVFPLMR